MHRPHIAHTCPVLLGLILLAGIGGGCAAMSYLGYRISPDHPRVENATINIEGLTAPVEIYLDEFGVAHIWATAENDLLRATGYAHGRERYFQMDMLRRFARGRLSELVGEQKLQFGSSVELDATMRGWGLEALAEQDATSMGTDNRARMEAYVAGVNAALVLHPPVEYRLLDVAPEPWTVADSFAVGRLVGWSITHNWHQELSRLVIACHAGIERATRIYSHLPWPGGTSVIGRSAKKPNLPAVAPELEELFKPRPPLSAKAHSAPSPRRLAATLSAFGWASNAWVLGGEHSASGKPLLANDPHMSHTLPSLMFQQHLRCEGMDVIGVTAPGLPYVLIGHNRQVAWGMTSAVGDAIDLYIEKPDPADPDRVLGPAGPEPLTRTQRIIRVRKGGRLIEQRSELRSTRRGPLVNDMYPGLLPDWAPLVSLRWDATGSGDSIEAFRQANRADDVAGLRRAMLSVATPVNSVMAADVSGAIALFPTGRLPKRRGHLGTFPAPAWLANYDWDGRVDPEQMPLFTAGPDGAFAHGNNLMYDPGSEPVHLQVDSAPSYRVDRILSLIGEKDKHDLSDMRRMQADVVLNRARRLLPPMLEDLAGLKGFMPREEQALALLAAWDGAAHGQRPEAAIFFITYREAMIAAMVDEVDQAGLSYLLSQRYFTNAVDLWYDDPAHPVWDDRATPATEGRAEVVQAAFRRAVVSLRETQGSDPKAWRWGVLHDMHARHPFGGKLPAFNLAHMEAHGGPDSIWKSHLDLGASKPFRAVAGPVYRMIVDLADPEHGLWIIDTGASGWPGSPHYADQHELWKKCDYAPMLMNWDEIRASAKGVLSLR